MAIRGVSAEIGAAHVYVVHEPNQASGGKASVVGLGDFLSQENMGPQHEALLRMIGGLVDQAEYLRLRHGDRRPLVFTVREDTEVLDQGGESKGPGHAAHC